MKPAISSIIISSGSGIIQYSCGKILDIAISNNANKENIPMIVVIVITSIGFGILSYWHFKLKERMLLMKKFHDRELINIINQLNANSQYFDSRIKSLASNLGLAFKDDSPQTPMDKKNMEVANNARAAMINEYNEAFRSEQNYEYTKQDFSIIKQTN